MGFRGAGDSFKIILLGVVVFSLFGLTQDAFAAHITDSAPINDPSKFIDISVAPNLGTQILGSSFAPNADDGQAAFSSVGFAGRPSFFGTGTITVGSNGGFSTSGGTLDYTNTSPLPGATAFGGNGETLLPWWDDLSVGGIAKVHYKVMADPVNGGNKLIVQYKLVQSAGSGVGGDVTFQAQIFECGDVAAIYSYPDVVFSSAGDGYSKAASATIGYQDGPAGAHSETFSFNTAYLNNGDYIEISDGQNITGGSCTGGSDTTPPTPTITSTESDPTNANPVPITITFNEPVFGFTQGDITVSSGVLEAFSGNDGDSVFTVIVSTPAEDTLTVDVADTVAQDGAGNDNNAAIQFAIDVDYTNPTTTITSTAPDPTNTSPIPLTITFDEPVFGFAQGDITVSSGILEGFSGSDGDTVFTVGLENPDEGQVTVDVAGGVAQDDAGNDNDVAAQFEIEFEATGPIPTITSTESDPTNANPVPITITFNEPVFGFTLGDITVNSGNPEGFTGSDGDTVFTVDIDTPSEGTLTVDVNAGVAQDGAANDNVAATQFAIDVDYTNPIPTISSTASDPTNTSPIPIQITFDEDVFGFGPGSISVTGGILSNYVAQDEQIYTFDLTPSGDGTLTVDVAAFAADDAAGNDNDAATQFTIEFNSSGPIPTITSTETSPTNAGLIPITITFSSDVFGFIEGDIIVNGGVVDEGLSGSGSVFTFDLAPSGDGTITVDVPAGVAEDAAGNDNVAATQFSIVSDTTGPDAVLSSAAGDPVAGVFSATLTFNEPIDPATLSFGDFDVTNAVLSNLANGPTIFTFDVTPVVDGLVEVTLDGGEVEDLAGNTNSASNILERTYIGPVPVVFYGIDSTGNMFTFDVTTPAINHIPNHPTFPIIDSTEIECNDLGTACYSQRAANFGAVSIIEEIDPSTSEVIGPAVNTPGAIHTGLEYVGTTLYTISWFGPGSGSTFGTVDPTTGVFTPVGSTGLDQITGLAFDVTNQIMYGVSGGAGGFAATSSLYTIDITTGLATLVGDTGISHLASLEFGPDGNLYAGGNSNEGGQIYQIDTDTGAATFVIQGSIAGKGVGGLTLVGTTGITNPPTSTEEFTGGNGGSVLSGPTIGIHPVTGNQVVKGGFGLDGTFYDVTEYWHEDLGWIVEPGDHSFSFKIHSEMGISSITDLKFGAMDIGTWFSQPALWEITLERGAGSDQWSITVVDESGLIGDVTFTVQEIDNTYLLITINIEGMEATPENVALYVKLLDDLFSSSTTIFNEGLTVDDIYSYPTAQVDFEESLDIPRVCKAEENPDDRNTCTFASKVHSEITKAEATLAQMRGESVPSIYSKSEVAFENAWNQIKDCTYGPQLPNSSCELANMVIDEMSKLDPDTKKVALALGPQTPEYYKYS